MKKKILWAAILAAFCATSKVSAQTNGGGTSGGDNNDTEFHTPHRGVQTSCEPQVSYDSASTVLSVMFSSNSQGGKVEIYRNGIKVVNASAQACASLCYMLRNYGKGEFKIIVRQGNTVVYSKQVTVK